MINKKIKLLIMILIMIAFNNEGQALNKGKVTIINKVNLPAKIINKEKEVLSFNGGGTTSGNMAIFNKAFFGENNMYYMYQINESDTYQYRTVSKLGAEFKMIGDKKNEICIAVNTNKPSIVEIKKDFNKLTCANCTYGINGGLANVDNYFYLSGHNNGVISIENKHHNLLLRGSKGLVDVIIDDLKGTSKSETHQLFYTYGKDLLIKKVNNTLQATNASKIPMITTNNVNLVYLEEANEGHDLFLSWTKVKKAKSYVIYQYNEVLKHYQQVKIIQSHEHNFYHIPNVRDNVKYIYMVQASKSSIGKSNFINKPSYSVSAVSANSKEGNVHTNKITVSNIIAYQGKTINLKTLATSKKNKHLFNDNMRWYTTNHQIIAINQHNGQMKLKKKGSAYIWAKAHNGKNTPYLKVTIK
ncbi:MAG: hypothetical protein LBT75_05135 [Bacilli bacterium]|jgi:hypothetical protein|nr:hypothetical protein [Bacilli bacterium]